MESEIKFSYPYKNKAVYFKTRAIRDGESPPGLNNGYDLITYGYRLLEMGHLL